MAKKYSNKYGHVEKQNDSFASTSIHTYEGEAEIVNKYGLHMRPVALFKKVIEHYDKDAIGVEVEVSIDKDRKKIADGKSVMGLITLEAGFGEMLHIQVKGNGTAEACRNDLVALVKSGFGGIDDSV